MFSYFRMQLRIHFRQLSSYLFPLIMGLFYIIIVLATKMTVKDQDNVIGILTSSVFHNGIINLSLFISFMISTFVAQTIYYKYKIEGVEILLYSKPLSRTNIYVANILAAIICILFSMFIITLGFFISLLCYPTSIINAELIAKKTGSFLLAMLFSSILILAVGSIIQSFVEMKVYLVIAGVIPFIIVLVLSFIKSPGQVDNVSVINEGYKKMSLLINKKPQPQNQEINRIKDSVEDGNNVLVHNQIDKEIYTFLDSNANPKKPKLDFLQTYNKAQNSLYRKIFWLNVEEYFLPLFSAYNLDLIKSSNFVKATPIEVFDKKGNFLEKDDPNIKALDLNSRVLFRIEDDQTKKINYVALCYDQNTINEYFRTKKGIDIEEIQSLIFSGATSLNINKLFSAFKNFNNLYIDEIWNYWSSDDYVLKEFFKNSDNKFKDYELDKLKFQKILLLLSSDQRLANISANVIDAILPPLDQNANSSEKIAYNTKKEKIKDGLFKASIFLLISREISEQKVKFKKSQIEAFLKEESNSDLINTYKMSFIKFIPLSYYDKQTNEYKSNFVVFNRYMPVSPSFSVIFHIVLSMTLFAIGLEIVKRKNYK